MIKYKLKIPKHAQAVVGAYHKVEGTVIGAYKKVENVVVGGYKAIETAFVDAFLKNVDDDGRAGDIMPPENK